MPSLPPPQRGQWPQWCTPWSPPCWTPSSTAWGTGTCRGPWENVSAGLSSPCEGPLLLWVGSYCDNPGSKPCQSETVNLRLCWGSALSLFIWNTIAWVSSMFLPPKQVSRTSFCDFYTLFSVHKCSSLVSSTQSRQSSITHQNGSNFVFSIDTKARFG